MLDSEYPFSGKPGFPAQSLPCRSSASMLRPNGMRTVYWFNELKARAGTSTIAELQRRIEPVPPAQRKEVQRRWGYYKAGCHKPCSRVVDLAERAVPGSSRIFHSDFWDCLRPDRDARALAFKLIGQTNSDGNILLRWMLNPKEPRYASCHVLVRRLDNVTLLGSLEALGVLVLCARLACMRVIHHLVQRLYLRIFDFLVVYVHHFRERGIAEALAEHFDLVLFKAFTLTPHVICRGATGYPEAAESLDRDFRKYGDERGLIVTPIELVLPKLNYFTVMSVRWPGQDASERLS